MVKNHCISWIVFLVIKEFNKLVIKCLVITYRVVAWAGLQDVLYLGFGVQLCGWQVLDCTQVGGESEDNTVSFMLTYIVRDRGTLYNCTDLGTLQLRCCRSVPGHIYIVLRISAPHNYIHNIIEICWLACVCVWGGEY